MCEQHPEIGLTTLFRGFFCVRQRATQLMENDTPENISSSIAKH